MLADRNSSAIVAVSDLARARAFYADTLGLEVVEDGHPVFVLRTGSTHLVVYTSDSAGTNKANAVVWDAGDAFDAIVEELRGKDITFEEYPEFGMDIVDGVHSDGDFKAVWFKDPDGNILHINSM